MRTFPLPALLAHALWEVLVPFSRWRFKHRVHRWQVAASALRLLATALAQVNTTSPHPSLAHARVHLNCATMLYGVSVVFPNLAVVAVRVMQPQG